MKREKPVENRTWRWMKHHDWDEDGKILLGIQSSTTICTDKNKERRAPGWQADESLQFGMLLGVVDLVRICPPNELTAVQRKHYIKQKGPETWCWVLENPRPFAPPIKKSGQSSLFYPELEESDLLSVLPVEQSGVATDFRYLTVTDANLRNNSLCVTGAQGLFPKAIYRASSKKLKYRVYVLWENQVIDTDIDSEKNIFRSRKWHAFFDFNRVQAGDQILLERLEPYLYRVSKSPRS